MNRYILFFIGFFQTIFIQAQVGDIDGFWKKVKESDEMEIVNTPSRDGKLSEYHARVLNIISQGLFFIEQHYTSPGTGETGISKSVGILSALELITSAHLAMPPAPSGHESASAAGIAYSGTFVRQVDSKSDSLRNIGSFSPVINGGLAVYPGSKLDPFILNTTITPSDPGVLFLFYTNASKGLQREAFVVSLKWAGGKASLPDHVDQKQLIGGIFIHERRKNAAIEYVVGGILSSADGKYFEILSPPTALVKPQSSSSKSKPIKKPKRVVESKGDAQETPKKEEAIKENKSKSTTSSRKGGSRQTTSERRG